MLVIMNNIIPDTDLVAEIETYNACQIMNNIVPDTDLVAEIETCKACRYEQYHTQYRVGS